MATRGAARPLSVLLVCFRVVDCPHACCRYGEDPLPDSFGYLSASPAAAPTPAPTVTPTTAPAQPVAEPRSQPKRPAHDKGAAGGEHKQKAKDEGKDKAAQASKGGGDKAKDKGNEKAKKEEKAAAPDDKRPLFARLDIRVGKILKAWKHPNADTLYVEEIDVGEEKPRQICSGLLKFIPLEHMQGAETLVICNLKRMHALLCHVCSCFRQRGPCKS